MSKYLLGLLVLLLSWGMVLSPAGAQEDILNNALERQLQEIDLTEIEDFLGQLDREVKVHLPELSLSNLFQDLKSGKINFNLAFFFQSILKYLFKELIANSTLLGKLVILAVIAAILQNLQTAFDQGTTAKLAYAVTYLALITIALTSFTLAINTGKAAIEQMVTFIQSLLPILLTLMAAIGGLSTAAILHPMIITALSLISTLTMNVIFPLIYFSAVLTIVNHISDKLQVSRLAGIFKDFSMGLLGLFLTVFIGVLTIQGVAGSVSDGIALRTAKFVTGSFVPVVGKIFTDALEAVVGTSLLLKNAVSLVGVVVIVILCLLPVIKIISMIIIYRLAAALIQPFGEGQMTAMLHSMANSLLLVFGAVAGVGLMFFMALTIIAGLGNFTVMLR